jgi:hypothetical protein
MTCGTCINDCEAAVAQACAPAISIDRIRNPDALIISAPVLDTLEHGADSRLRIQANYSRNPAHLINCRLPIADCRFISPGARTKCPKKLAIGNWQ